MSQRQTNGNPWPMATIGDAISAIETGSSPKTLDRPVIGNERGVLKVSAVTWQEFRAHESKALLPDFDTTGIPTVQKGDLLLSRANTAELLASPVLVQDDHPNLILSDKTLRLVPRPTIDSRFLLYALRQPEARQFFRSNATGTSGSMRNVSQETIRRCPIPLPPLSEQKRIADILDKADAIRRKRQEAIGLTEQLIRSAFLDMFGDPVANPRQWPVKRLQDISTRIMSGTTPKGGKHVYPEEGITFFRSQNVWRNRIVLDDIAYIDERTHRAMARSSLKKKDILITKTGRFNTENSSLGRAAIFMGQDDSANINGHVYLVRLEAEAIHEFILFILTMDEYREHIRRVCVGGIDKRQINKEHLEEFPIISPPRNLQLRFADIVKSHERHSERMKTQRAEANDLFNSLVQRAFKGEL